MRKLSTIFLAVLCAVMLTGCDSGTTSKENTSAVIDAATRENRQNDYRGGVIRTLSLKTNVLAIMDGMKSNNDIIRDGNPNSFWTTNGYQDFVATFLTAPIINDTQWFNEEETDFATAVNQMFSVANSFTVAGDEGYQAKSSSISPRRNEKDDYSITGLSGNIADNSAYNGSVEYRILYDCDKDWCKAYTTLTIGGSSIPNVTSEMFEYARINNDTFAIQTSNERLLVILEPTDEDTDIRNRKIKEFYYSRLTGGQRTTFVPYESLPDTDEDGKVISENRNKNNMMTKYSLLNDKGDIAVQYGVSNSLFTGENLAATDYSWVFEDGALQQAIIYKQDMLVVTTYNKLSEKYERFIYSVNAIDENLVAEIEKMVNIEGLVGYVDVKVTVTPSDTPSNADENNSGGNTTSGTESEQSDTSSSDDTTSSNPDETTNSDTSQSENSSSKPDTSSGVQNE